ncbi:ankyrin repeat protein, putative [Trichomonas vaginalis G3]|uniref:Ankyrin repeat protein, putative n=1 Tax=Trichomonas vaginalis (strain ATCC PRA-98 / G3) TaxID=412133 RepID=A2DPD9_TRIV3|nr:spectrin binding [Trichomonas vaginalis G3]EAY17683.1 ankyrin repeat protein, putative [Trichomonas vaginalis G3]KAI5507913.1 spectrin binding [Trichomonas vaginalis G3]|eukprot:XP_001329818.1 ankyrin repeat protein [Trichomonas vaginalis G3]
MIYKLVEAKYASISELLSLFENDTIFYLWLAPEIEEINPGSFMELKNVNKYLLQKKKSFFENNFKLLKDYRLGQGNEDALADILRNDDIDALQVCFTNPNFDINKTIQFSIFFKEFFLQRKPSLIQIAAYYKSVKCFNFLRLNEADLMKEDSFGRKLTYFAVAGGDLKIIDICEESELDFTGVLNVCVQFHNLELLKWLIEVKKIKGIEEAILESCLDNDIECLDYLIKKSTNINVVNDKNSNAFHLACARNNFMIIKLLNHYDVDPNLLNVNDVTPLMLAILRNHSESIDELLNNKRLYLEKRNSKGESALMISISSSKIETIKNLISKGADINTKDNFGFSCLHQAIINRRIDCIEYFLENGKIDINIQANDKWTPLHYAAQFGFADITKILLSHHDIKLVYDENGESPIEIAKKNKRHDVHQLLINHFK